MLVTELYNGQGLGNQLWCYVVTRVIAKDNGYDFGIMHPEKCKCSDFMPLDFGKQVIGGTGPEGGVPRTLPEGIDYYYAERSIFHPLTRTDIRTYDATLPTIADNTKIDGIMQDEKYIVHRKDEIRTWLQCEATPEATAYANDDVCIINFRGGEYVRVKEVFLPKKYWLDAIAHMRIINPKFRFVVVTDDVPTARKFFPDFEISHKSIASDYAILAHAHYLILSNSSFAWFPAWLSRSAKKILAPKYWAAHNTSDGYWSTSGAITEGFTYIDRAGALYDTATCTAEFEAYKKSHADYFARPKHDDMFFVVSNYYNDIAWVSEYASAYRIYDQSASAILPPTIEKKNVIPSEHRGHNIRDYCTYIIENYDALPERVLFCAGNVFPRHVSESYFKSALTQDGFVPLFEVSRHNPHMPMARISDTGLYAEYNNSWYLRHHPTKYFHTYNDFLRFCFVNPIIPTYIEFAPGANYIVPRELIHKYPKAFYENLRLFVSHTDTAIAGESHIIERALYTLWHDTHELTAAVQTPLPSNFAGVTKKRTVYAPYDAYVRILSGIYSITGKLQFAWKKFPALLQYFSGKRDFKNLLIRIADTRIGNSAKKIYRAPRSIMHKSSLYLHKAASIVATGIYTLRPLQKEALADYRKEIRIYDVFTFFNELELLEMRLEILAPYVDFFVIVECAETFSGKHKPLYYAENKERFAKFHTKIRHYIVEHVPASREELAARLHTNTLDPLEREIITNALASDNVPKDQLHWLKEFYQKESIKKALIGLSPNDICYIGDVDEIWNPETLIDYRSNAIFKLRQKVYAYFLNNRSNEPWAGTLVTKYRNIQKACLNHLRTARKTTYTYIENAGWHFTNMGGPERIKSKLESYGHQEFNTTTIKSELENKIKNNQDFVGRKFKFWTDEKDLPKQLKTHREKYRELFK